MFFTQFLLHKSGSSLPIGSAHYARCNLPRTTKSPIFFKQERLSLLWYTLKKKHRHLNGETNPTVTRSWAGPTRITVTILLLMFPQYLKSPPARLCTIPTVKGLLIRRDWLKDGRMEAEIIKAKHKESSSSQMNWSNIFPPLNRQGFFPLSNSLFPFFFFLLLLSWLCDSWF